ncbi:hypothetical protein [Crinalium epipsammum]|uniref:hypothetical protein n=1 Tax=Crinalium epipsammum TaxID=241425 RepID=UPI000305C3D4|nr:hypothetical protein [Crinalium epipsammum]
MILSGLFAATQAIAACFRQLKEHGTTSGNNLVDFHEFEQIIDIPKYRQLEQQFKSK